MYNKISSSKGKIYYEIKIKMKNQTNETRTKTVTLVITRTIKSKISLKTKGRPHKILSLVQKKNVEKTIS